METTILAIIAFVAIVLNLLQWFLSKSSRNIIEEQNGEIGRINQELRSAALSLKKKKKEKENITESLEISKQTEDDANCAIGILTLENRGLREKLSKFTNHQRDERGRFVKKIEKLEERVEQLESEVTYWEHRNEDAVCRIKDEL
jgi:chromosome segregation ATPase